MQKLPRKCKKKCVTDWPINGPTNGSTNGPTNQQTDRVEYRVTCMWLKYFSLQKWSRCSELQQKPLRRIQVRKNTGFSCKLWEINYLPWFFPSYHLKMPIKLDLQQDFNPMFTPWQVSMINHQGYHVKIRLNSQCSVLNDFFLPKMRYFDLFLPYTVKIGLVF